MKILHVSYKDTLSREINAHFVINEQGEPSFLFCACQENKTPNDISKFEEIVTIQ